MDLLSLDAMCKLPDLTDQEALALAVAAQAGNIEARDQLVHRHLRLVVYMAKIFARSDANLFDDLFQYGAEILIGSIEKFEPTRNIPFRTWAAQQLRFYLWRHITRQHRRYNEVLQEYAEEMLHEDPQVLSPAEHDEDYKELADMCLCAERYRWIKRHQSMIFLMRARGLYDKQISERMGGIHRNTIRRHYKHTLGILQEFFGYGH